VGGFGAFVSVQVDASLNTPPFLSGSASSSANFSGDYVLTVFGGTGETVYNPCFMSISRSHFDGVTGLAGLGGRPLFDLTSLPFLTNCTGTFNNQLFEVATFGVPQVVPITIEETATESSIESGFLGEADLSATLEYVRFFDTSFESTSEPLSRSCRFQSLRWGRW
jgi:hypothetical protein